jgi:diguanylate cyclase
MGAAEHFSGDRSLVDGETAFGHIRHHGHRAHPHIYETWYTYVSGSHRNLSHALDGLLRDDHRIEEAEITRIYNEHLAEIRIASRLEHVGGTMSDEIETVLGLIGGARDTADQHAQALGDMTTMVATEAGAAVQTAIAELVRRMVVANADLQTRLDASRKQMMQLKGALEAVKAETMIDPLTMLFNRKSFDQELTRLIDGGHNFTLLLADIDGFKKFNDLHGHLTGDQVLRLVCRTVREGVRRDDMVARFGGEEIAIILPNADGAAGERVANTLREAVMTRELIKRSTGERLGRVTISVGVGTHRDGDTLQSLIERTDRCLYEAKAAGRNCVVGEAQLERA